MSEFPEVETLARLLELAARYGLEELEVEEDGLRVTLRAQVSPGDENGEGMGYLWQPPAWSAPAKPGRPETAHPLHAPLTGTFYRAESPEAPPYVELGAHVDEGQKVGLIEAMKVFSDVTADRSGTVVEIVVQNGRLVHHGEVLLYIDPAP